MQVRLALTSLLVALAAVAGAQNLARKAHATVSSQRPEYPAPGVNDGDMGTSWSVHLGARVGEWLQFDWDEPQTVAGVVLYPTGPYLAAFDMQIPDEVSGFGCRVSGVGIPLLPGRAPGGDDFRLPIPEFRSADTRYATPETRWKTIAHFEGPELSTLKRIALAFQPQTTRSLRLANLTPTRFGGPAFFEVELYSDTEVIEKMRKQVDIAVSGDACGRLIGVAAIDEGTTGLYGAAVTVSGKTPLGGWQRTATAGENGLFVVDLPVGTQGPVTASVENSERKGKFSVDASDLPLTLTPRMQQGRVSLEGDWEILPDPPSDLAKAKGWQKTKVPSHWEMEGFRAKTGVAAYRKRFTLPKGWDGKRIKLRPDGIYSHCEVWLNGTRVGSHDGGATPFELDLTGAAKPGAENEILMLIQARSPAESIDHMSVYACFELAGIWRPIEVFAVEPTHIGRLTWETKFDKEYKNADLNVHVRVVNESDKPVRNLPLAAKLVDRKGKETPVGSVTVSLGPWESKDVTLAATIKNPEHWNAEQPRCYKLSVSLKSAVVEQTVGFRAIEVKGRKFTIDGKLARLWGACLHCSDPILGRALTPAMVRGDVEMMKGANLNAIRTSHYSPHPALAGFADEIGMFIEDEGPACWADNNDNLLYAPLYMGIYSAFVERDRNHPSVTYWSICNESNWGRIFQMTQQYVKRLDPTRPSGGSYAPPEDKADVMVHHHPINLSRIREFAGLPKPVFFDECLTVFHGWGDLAYSTELDPGMNDYWVTGFPEIIRSEINTANQVGTMIWAWVDDAFLVPGKGIAYWRRSLPQIRYTDSVYKLPGRGYVGDCVWGVVDAWRRPRPEWWLCKKVYSPVQIAEKPLALGSPIQVPVENLGFFADLSEYQCKWEIGSKKGTAKANVPPQGKGFLEIPAEPKVDDTLVLSFYDGKRFVDGYRLKFKPHEKPAWRVGKPAEIAEEVGKYLQDESVLFLRGTATELAYERTSGGLQWGLAGKEQVLLKGPDLHILKSDAPLGHDPSGWQFKGETHELGLVKWNGLFGSDLTGGYQIKMDRDGDAEFSYEFKYTGPDLWIRELGLGFELPLQFDRLEWDRRSEFSLYPADHIGRTHGVAMAHTGLSVTGYGVQGTGYGEPISALRALAQPDEMLAGTDTRHPKPDTPSPSYSLDDHPWGSNDFRSSKRNIYGASLKDPRGFGVEVVSDGTQTVRAAVGTHAVSLYVLDFYGGVGAPDSWAVQGFHYNAGRLVKTGEVLKGTVKLRLLSGKL